MVMRDEGLEVYTFSISENNIGLLVDWCLGRNLEIRNYIQFFKFYNLLLFQGYCLSADRD